MTETFRVPPLIRGLRGNQERSLSGPATVFRESSFIAKAIHWPGVVCSDPFAQTTGWEGE